MQKLFIKRSEAKKTQEEKGSSFDEYDLPFQSLAVGISHINGRYPEEGMDVDTEIEQIWYVESGDADIYLQDQLFHIEYGDMVLVPKGKKFWIEGHNLKLVVSSSPPWFYEQHKHLS